MSAKYREQLKELATDIEFRCRAARDAHFLAGRRWDTIGLWLGISVVLVGVVGGGGGGIYTSNATVAAVFAAMAGLLGAVSSFLKPSEKVDRHKKAGDAWSVLRDRAANLYKLQMEHSSNVSDDELQKLYDTLLELKKKVTEDSPIIPTWAYDKAYKKLKEKMK